MVISSSGNDQIDIQVIGWYEQCCAMYLGNR